MHRLPRLMGMRPLGRRQRASTAAQPATMEGNGAAAHCGGNKHDPGGGAFSPTDQVLQQTAELFITGIVDRPFCLAGRWWGDPGGIPKSLFRNENE